MPITADLSPRGNRIVITSTRPLKALDKMVPGAYFSTHGGAHWTVPLSLITLRILRKKFREELRLTDKLAKWRAAKIGEERALQELVRQEREYVGAGWRDRYPDLYKALQSRPYQTVGARFIALARSALVMDGVGLGKTIQTLAGIMESGVAGPYLVICPKTAGPAVWGPEIQRWLPDHFAAVMPEGAEMRHRYLRRALVTPKRPVLWVIINPRMLQTKSYWECSKCGVRTPATKSKKELQCGHDPRRARPIQEHEFPELFESEWGAIVVDESHRVVIKRSRVNTQTRSGAMALQTREDGVRVCQSSTPFDSNPPLLFGTLQFLREKEYSSYWSWAQSFWHVSPGYGNSLEIGPLKDLNGLRRSLRSIMIRRTREEVAPHLPPRQYLGQPHPERRPEVGEPPVGVWLEMSARQRKAYEQMREWSVAQVENGELDAIGSLAELTRLRQFATCFAKLNDRGRWEPALPSNKLDYLLEVVYPELGFDDEPATKLVVVSQFTKILELFAAETDEVYGRGFSCLLTGSVTGAGRAEIVERFNKPGKQPFVMFLNMDAGGESITLDVADEMVFLDEKHNPDVMEQVEGRIDNRRPEEKIVQRRYRYLRSLNTVEDEIAFVARERNFNANLILQNSEDFVKKALKMQ